VTINVTPTQAGTPINTATVSSDNPDSNTSNNSATASTTVQPAQTYSISGTVFDDQNNPVPNATVTVNGSFSNSISADANGHYSFANLAAGGTYYIQPSSTCRDSYTAQTFSNLSSNQTNANFTGTINNYLIYGRVTEDNQIGISGVTVTLTVNGGRQTATQTTDANGNYSFNTVQAGSSYADADKGWIYLYAAKCIS
jgi:uncharacterized GH25 family protein